MTAVLWRSGKPHVPAVHLDGELTLDAIRREVRTGAERTVSQTPLEIRLFRCLMINAGYVLTGEAIIDQVWGPEGGDRTCSANWSAAFAEKFSLIRTSRPTSKIWPDLVMARFYFRIAA